MNQRIIKIVLWAAVLAGGMLLLENRCCGMEQKSTTPPNLNANDANKPSSTTNNNSAVDVMSNKEIKTEELDFELPRTVRFKQWISKPYNNNKQLLAGLWLGLLGGSIAGASFMAKALHCFKPKNNPSPTAFYVYIDIPGWIEKWWELPWYIKGLTVSGVYASYRGIKWAYNNFEIRKKAAKPANPQPNTSGPVTTININSTSSHDTNKKTNDN